MTEINDYVFELGLGRSGFAIMPFVQDYAIFEESELERIGVVCPVCGTEAIFDLGKDQTANQTKPCPGCGGDLVTSFTTEARQSYNWVTYYKRGRDVKKAVTLRFYFRRSG